MPRKPKVRWSRLAERDFDRTHAYWMDQSPRTAARFAKAVLQAVRRAQDSPDAGAPLRELGPSPLYRAMSAIWYYRVVYRVEDDLLLVFRIWDARREPEALVPDEPLAE